MNPDQDRKEALFEAARHLASRAERAAYLDRACGDDRELRRQIEALLELQAPANEYFGSASFPGPAARTSTRNDPPGHEAGPSQGRVGNGET